jgi:hypothetical protein
MTSHEAKLQSLERAEDWDDIKGEFSLSEVISALRQSVKRLIYNNTEAAREKRALYNKKRQLMMKEINRRIANGEITLEDLEEES